MTMFLLGIIVGICLTLLAPFLLAKVKAWIS